MKENKRTAVLIGVTLSTQLISASLSMLAIVGALVVFMIDKRETNIGFIILFGLGFLSFLFSIIKGGKGIDIVRKQGFQKNWNLDYSKSFFNAQAIFNIVGIILCLVGFLFTKPKIDEQNEEFKKLNQNFKSLIEYKIAEQTDLDSLKIELYNLKTRLDKIENSNKQ